jgi:hypothetical protein
MILHVQTPHGLATKEEDELLTEAIRQVVQKQMAPVMIWRRKVVLAPVNPSSSRPISSS